ncbi:MAG: DUF805 domain-containing protein [Treponema sp.]|nr:DUF805 domain-containing protein [Treponema sp.]
MNLRFLIISIAISLLVTAIVIHSTHGRISRERYWKIEIIMIGGFASYCFFTIFIMAFYYWMHVLQTLLFVIGIIGSFIFMYKYWQLQILRLHDLNKSGWYCLLDFIPFYNIYDFFVMNIKKRSIMLNEFDETIDYFSFFEKNKLLQDKKLITKDGVDFYVNGIKFEYKNFNGHVQYEVSKMSLENDKALEEYCMKNLQQTENAPGYAGEYRISFLDEGNLFEKLKNDLHGIVIDDGFITINEVPFFVRENYLQYEIVYKTKDSSRIKNFSQVEELQDYSCQSLTKAQLLDLINAPRSKLRGMSSS